KPSSPTASTVVRKAGAPAEPFRQVTSELPIPPRVTYHSIIGCAKEEGQSAGGRQPYRPSTLQSISSTGVVIAMICIAKLLLTPKLRWQPLFAAVLPQRSTKLVAGSPVGMEPTVGVSLRRQKVLLREELIRTEIVLSTSAPRLTGGLNEKTTVKMVPSAGAWMPVRVEVEPAINTPGPLPHGVLPAPLVVQS